MSLETALNRALYRHLDYLCQVAFDHYVRSHNERYYDCYRRLYKRMLQVELLCHYPDRMIDLI